MIPGVLEVQFNFRYSPESNADAIAQRVESILNRHGLDFSLHWIRSGLPYLTPPGRLTEVVSRAIHTELGLRPRSSTSGGTSDGRFIAPTGAEVIEFGPVNQTIHKANECVDVQDPDKLSRVYYRILAALLT